MTKKKNYTIVDLFSGVGGLSLGFEKNGFNLLLANDNDQDAANTFKLNHPDKKFYLGNIQEIDEKLLERMIDNKKVDVLVGGIPCQSFSMVGFRTTNKSNHSKDPRHYLFKEFIRIAKILSPKVIIIENVKAIISSHGGKIKNEIISDLGKIGYQIDYKILNAADYGVPQTRERAIFIGNNIGVKNIFPKPTHSPENYVGVGEAFKNLPKNNYLRRK